LAKLSTIAVIDDDASVRTATNNLLCSHGYTVHTYASAVAFLESARLDESSCVIADVHMPEMNGLDLLTAMRARDKKAPFIFITAFPEESIRARAIKAGAAGFLVKPFSGAVLINCIETALKPDQSGTGE
jgi:FixJ family two-component response regulator